MKVGIIVNPQKSAASQVIKRILRALEKKGVGYLVEKSGAVELGIKEKISSVQKIVDNCQLIIALGGDGTLLKTARLVGSKAIPIMGVNLGGLGFLTEFGQEEVEKAIDDYLKKNCREEERMVLAGSFKDEEFYALNDFSINMGESARVLEIILYTQGNYITQFVGDGVVIATPTGSTAYSLAAGGPIFFPIMEAILVTPISPHALSCRPLIIPADETLTVKLKKDSPSGILMIDGQERRPILSQESVTFKKAPYKVRLVAPKGKSYYEILRHKMKWGGREENG